MKSEGKSKTENCASKECTEDHLLLEVHLPGGPDEKIDGGADEHDATE